MNVLEVDGSHGEGGGQILRMAVSLSALTSRPVRVTKIRARRRNPGLAAQHLTAVRAVAALCDAETQGLALDSTTLEFRPKELRDGRFSFDVGTAGSVTLVLQACLPAALEAGDVELTVTGGTDVPWSPPLDYFGHVFLGLARKLGARAEVEVERRGYYPRGGGRVRVRVRGTEAWAPLQLGKRSEVERIAGRAHASNLPPEVVKRMKSAALKRFFTDVRIHDETLDPDSAVGPGGAIVLWAETAETILGADALAARGKRAEKVGEEAADALVKEIASGATLDVHAADQMLPYLARATGPSVFLVREVSEHARTMMWLITAFLGTQFEVTSQGSLHRVEVRPAKNR